MPEKPITFETRTVLTEFEVRGLDGDKPTIEGYAATFNQPYDLGPFVEQLSADAFTRTLANGPDVRLLVDHAGQPLARTKSGTLTLSADDTGLLMRSELDPADPDVQRLIPKMKRGDLDQMSFAFRVPVGGDTWSPDYTSRTITEANLSGGDVSVVTFPANPNTTVSVRALDEREAGCVFAEAVVRELRAGKAISAANMTKLSTILAGLAEADGHITSALADLSGVLGVDNPDPDAQQNSADFGLALNVARARFALLNL